MSSVRSRLRRPLARLIAVAILPTASLALASVPLAAQATTSAVGGCQLHSSGGAIKHVIQLQFDNVHFRRDNPNVPSDIEQMPNLYNFLVGNGTVLNNHHTPLISHTGTDILTTLTGVYPDRHGQPVSNTFLFYGPDGTAHTALTFAYWTDLAQAFDGTAENKYNLVDAQGNNPPAPWVPYTRAGCNFGAVGTANIELERIANVATVYGAGSPEAIQASDTSDNGQAKTTADFIGVAIHCAKGASLCGTANRGVADVLPAEPGGYHGFNGLFGHKYLAPQISASLPMTDLDGNVINNFAADGTAYPGFPGFNGTSAAVSLAYVAAMQEHGVPITTAYISAAHEKADTGLGPGDPVYEQNLRNYDEAFGKFFARLAADGINKSNTLFVFTVDEGDHFVGDQPTPAGCDGVTTPCNYNRVGEINADLRRMVLTQTGDTTAFTVHSDDAPTVYVTGMPAQTDPVVRKLERETAGLHWLNPYTGVDESNIMVALADHTGMKTLHIITADPYRTPTFTPFADPDWFFFATGGGTCVTPAACAFIPPRSNNSFAWNHGDIQDEIASTWIGLVGPGVDQAGVNSATWSDHTDVRPTILALLGLKDDYTQDGRLLSEALTGWAIPSAVKKSGNFAPLAQVYKQLNASFGAFDMDILKASTKALASDDAGDATYTSIEGQIASLTAQRDALAGQIKSALSGATFTGQVLSDQQANSLIAQANSLIDQAHTLATA